MPARASLRSFIAALFAVAVFCPAATAQEAKHYRWKFQAGEKLSLRFDQELTQSARVGDQPLNTTIDLGLSISWLVEKVAEDGEATIVQTIDRVQASMDAPPAAKATYDSADAKRTAPFARSVHAAVAPLLAVSVRQTVSPRGQVLAVESTPARQGEAEQKEGSPLSKEQLEAILGQAAIIFPQEPISPGFSWKQAIGASGVTLTYAGEPVADNGLSRFNLSLELANPKADPSRPSLKIVDQKSGGFLLFDSEAGRIVSSEMATSATVQTTLSDEKVQSTLSTTTKLVVTPAE